MNDLNTQTPTLVIDFEHDERKKQKHLLLHISNLLKDLGDRPLLIEVVTYGPGITLLVSSQTEFSEQIARLQQQGVQFDVCRNAMKKFAIEDNDLLPGVIPVSSGIGKIVKTQLDGAAYFKG